MQVVPLERHVKASDLPPERLAASSQLSEDQKVGEVSRQFEAVLLRQILEQAQKPIVQSSLVKDSASASIYRDLNTQQLADSISKSGSFGLAKTVASQLGRQLNPHAVPAGAAGHPAVRFGSQLADRAAAVARPARQVHEHGAELLRAPRAARPTPPLKFPSIARHHD